MGKKPKRIQDGPKLVFRCSKNEKELFKKAAESRGLNTSIWARRILKRVAKKQLGIEEEK